MRLAALCDGAINAWSWCPLGQSLGVRTEALGLVRVRNPEGTISKWCERSEVDALLEAGWLLADADA